MPRISKDCFGTVISTLHKMKECVRCELLAECRSMNWSAPDAETPPVVRRVVPDAGNGSEGRGAGSAPA